MKALKDFNPQITANFHLNELTCKDGTAVPWNLLDNAVLLLINLQVLRDELNATRAANEPEIGIHFTSAFRTISHNKSQDGATSSYHIKAMAGDIWAGIKLPGGKIKVMRTPVQIAALIEKLIKAGKMKQGGIGTYSSWVHYDPRGTAARWNG